MTVTGDVTAATEREAALQAEIGQLRLILDRAVDCGIIATDLDGTVTFWNARARDILGCSEAEMHGPLRPGRGADARWLQRKDGSRVWARSELMLLRDAGGADQGVVEILRDETEQREAAEQQRADMAFMRSVLAASDDCIKVVGLDGSLIFVSEGGHRALEISDFNAIQGCPWPDFWQGEGKIAAEAALEAARKGGTGRFLGFADTMAGNPRYWDVQVTPIRDAAGLPEKLLVVSRDITGTWRAAAALRDSEAYWRGLFDQLQEGFVVGEVIRDPQGAVLDWRYIDVNPAWEALAGIPRAAAIGRTMRGLMPGTADEWITVCAQVVGTQEAAMFTRAAGARGQWFEVRAFPLESDRFALLLMDVTVRRQAEREVRQLAGLVEQSTDFIGEVEPDGRILFVNPAGRTLVGLPDLAAAQATTIVDYFAACDRDIFLGTVIPAVREHGFWQGEMNFRDFGTGTILPVLYNMFSLRDASGTVTGYGTVTRDLREERKAESRRAALLELSDGLRDMTDTTGMAFVAAMVMGRALGVSGAGYGTLDADGEILMVDKDWTAPDVPSIVGRHHMSQYGTYIEDLRRGRNVVIDDVRLDPRTAADGALLEAASVRALINLPLIEHGKLVALFYVFDNAPRAWTLEKLGFIRNVAERARSAIERRRAEDGLRSLAASLEQQVEARTRERDRLWRLSRDPFLIIDEAGRWLSINPAWTELLGWSEAELTGHTSEWMEHPEDRVRNRETIRAAASGTRTVQFETRFRARNDSYLWFSLTAVAVEGLLYCVARDVTAEKDLAEQRARLEDQLRQSQKMEAVGQLTSGLAHDFNNLLTGIAGSLDLMKVRLGQGRVAGLDRYIDAAQGAAKRAAALTHRLLAFSRQQTLDPKPTDVGRLIAGMEDLVRQTVGPHIAMEPATAEDNLWTTLVDQGQLENALLNLCINARDAMPDGGTLLVEAGNCRLDEHAAKERDLPAGEYVTLSVSDNGTGMPPEVIMRAFDPFFTTKPIGQGTGLGLSMIYGFARQTGGQVRIHSMVGHGTTIRLYLPRHIGAAEPSALPTEMAGISVVNHDATVLVVDDEPAVRLLVMEVLEDMGCIAIEAEDGFAGLDVLNSEIRIDLLVTDVGLPGGMNGRQLADAARLTRPDLKVLFITGYAENAVLSHDYLQPGMHVLTKPFELEILASRIRALTARP